MVKRKFISTRLLENGMRIDQAIVDGSGRALIAKGAYLDDFQIEYLHTRGVNGVYIREGEEDPEEEIIPLYTQEVIEKKSRGGSCQGKAVRECEAACG